MAASSSAFSSRWRSVTSSRSKLSVSVRRSVMSFVIVFSIFV